MNARMYDPTRGRFLQPDTYVQYPETTQGFNRYTYVENNPLSYTDPTGNFIDGIPYASPEQYGSDLDQFMSSDTDFASVEFDSILSEGVAPGGGDGNANGDTHSISSGDGSGSQSGTSGGAGKPSVSGDGSKSTAARSEKSGRKKKGYFDLRPPGGCKDVNPSCTKADVERDKNAGNKKLSEFLSSVNKVYKKWVGGVFQLPIKDPVIRGIFQLAHMGLTLGNLGSALKNLPKALGHLRIGHHVPWDKMTKAQRRAFQHSYSRHGKELGLPKWSQKNAESLRKQFNSVVGHIRETGTYMGTRFKPVNGVSTRVNYYESTIRGTKYYYFETLSGKFVSAGKVTR